MIAVIADDITGAAEIAGTGLRFGMRVALVTDLEAGIPQTDLLVYATDTRSMSEMEAMDETRRVFRQLNEAGCWDLFKKTDSALRGYVVAELKEILRESGYERVVYLPENPSKGRIIRDGIYYIDGVPLDETLFASDPEFPAQTAQVEKRLPEITSVISPESRLEAEGIFAANAENEDDIQKYLLRKDDRTMLAGGADLFAGYLKSLGWKEKTQEPFEGLGEKNAIIVCGSTASHSLEEFAYFKRKPVPLMTMPQDVFDLKQAPHGWFTALGEAYDLNGSVALAVGHPVRRDKNYALRLRNIMALAASSLVDASLPDELIIEGGATAFSILRLLGWTEFHITDEIAPGIVRMSLIEEPDVHVTLKPGSYPWSEKLFQ